MLARGTGWVCIQGCDNAEPVTQLDMVFHTVAQGLSYLSGILVVGQVCRRIAQGLLHPLARPVTRATWVWHGQAASLLANYDASATAVREKVASVSTYLHDIGLPKHMQLTVRTWRPSCVVTSCGNHAMLSSVPIVCVWIHRQVLLVPEQATSEQPQCRKHAF